MRISILKQGIYGVTKNKDFPLIDDNTCFFGPKISIQPFLITTANDFIILDTGLALNNNNPQSLIQLLKKEDIHPEQITKVLISHLHKDHIGGIGHFERSHFKGNFPNAKIYIQKRELDYALTQQDNPSFDFKILTNLNSIPNLILLNEDKGTISDEIFYEVSGGHTPFHQVFWIKENEETLFFGADNLPQLSYWDLRLTIKNDFNGKNALLHRQKWKKLTEEEYWTILFYHDIENPFIKTTIKKYS
jgi:glyoxylase-like metal-dependent hydrolase (beta-lactamase superfamily II)